MFFVNDTTTAGICTLSLHDALPISSGGCSAAASAWRYFASDSRNFGVGSLPSGNGGTKSGMKADQPYFAARDRKSTRLNSSHANISYAVFCLKKKRLSHHNTFSCPT